VIFFQKHDFAVLVHIVYHDYQNLHFWNLNSFPKYKIGTCTHIIEEQTEKSSTYQFHGGGKALLFSFDELFPYASTDLHEQQYQFLQGVKKKQKHSLVLNDGDVLCNVPLNILASKLTLKTAKELANLHDMYQTRRDDSRCSPSSLQASWYVWDTWNSLLGIRRGEGKTKNTIFYHFIDLECCDSGQEKWITVQACQSILQCSRGK